VEAELVDREEPGPIRSAATSAPSNAAIAVMKPAIAVNIPGMELQNPPVAFIFTHDEPSAVRRHLHFQC
jgi:hypothetical protein